MGIPIVNESFTLTCNATISDNLVGLAIVNVRWLYIETIRDNVTLIYKGDNSATLTFSPVSSIQEGLYTCIATISIPGIPLQKILAEIIPSVHLVKLIQKSHNKYNCLYLYR